ncbi:MAG: reductase [Frankiales bacterium]|jgi:FMN reductase|nr:reductase [Frankiales bacterium]
MYQVKFVNRGPCLAWSRLCQRVLTDDYRKVFLMTGVVLLDGNPRAGSRTAGIARQVAAAVASRLDLPVGAEVSLSGLLPALASTAEAATAEVDAALDLVTTAEVLVVATPLYKATYTGLLKLFVDRFPRDALAGTVAIPLVTAGFAGQLLAAEVHLRPLLVEVGAAVPTRAFVLTEAEFSEVDGAVSRWLTAAEPMLRRALPQRV